MRGERGYYVRRHECGHGWVVVTRETERDGWYPTYRVSEHIYGTREQAREAVREIKRGGTR